MHLLKTIDSNRCFAALVYEVIPYYSSTPPQSAGRPDCHMSTATSRATTLGDMNNAEGAARHGHAEGALPGLPQQSARPPAVPPPAPLPGGGGGGVGGRRAPDTSGALQRRIAAATSRLAARWCPHPPIPTPLRAAGGLPPQSAAGAAGERGPHGPRPAAPALPSGAPRQGRPRPRALAR